MKKHTFIKLLSSFAFFSVAPDLLLSLPQNAEIASGTAEFTQSEPSSLVISTSDKAIINYKSFDIGKKEKVKFIQPSSSSSVLNRVKGKDPSKILGSLESNGRVFLVNPKGVYFGPSATVNVGSLIVSALDIADQDFIDDKFQFSLSKEGKNSKILNEGLLSASSEGSIVLLAPKIQNKGIIEAKAGKVLLAAGEAVTLDFSGDGLISFSVDGDLKEAVIEHLGKIQAPEGDVYLRLNAAEKVIKTIINTDGLEEGAVFVEEAGGIRLVSLSTIESKNISVEGREHSDILVQGSLDVSSNTCGGTIYITGEDIRVEGANINASGDQGGGIVLIGGDYQGKGEIFRSQSTIVDQASTIKADAISQGNGGQVIIWSDGRTLFEGTVFARGGSLGGNGGLVETSGKEILQVTGLVNTLASLGKAGNWLLDPTTITIVSGPPAGLTPFDCNDSTTPVFTNGTINGILTNLTLCAASSITQDAGAAIDIAAAGVGLTFQGVGGGAVTTTLNDNITTNGGAVTFNTDGSVGTTNSVVLGAPVVIDTSSGSGGLILFDTPIDGAQNLTLTSGLNTTTLNGVIGGGGAIGALSITAASMVFLGNNISSSGLDITPPVTLTGNVGINGNGSFVQFANTVDGTFNFDLTTAAANMQLSAALGSITPIGSFSVHDAALATIGGNITATSVNLASTAPIFLGGPVIIDTSAAPGSVTIDSTIDGIQTLSVNAGTSSLNLSGGIGTATPLSSLDLTANDPVLGVSVASIGTVGVLGVNGPVTMTSTGVINLNGANYNAQAQTFAGNVNLGTDIFIQGNGNDILFEGTINGGQSLGIDASGLAGTGSVTIQGNVGSVTPINAFNVTGNAGITLGNIGLLLTAGSGTTTINTSTTTSLNGSIYHTNEITFNGDVQLNVDTSMITDNFAAIFGGNISGTRNLSINTDTNAIIFGGSVATLGTGIGTTSLFLQGDNLGAPINFPSILILNGGLTAVMGDGTTPQDVTFNDHTVVGNILVGALSSVAGVYDVVIGNGGIVTGGTTFANTGLIVLYGGLTSLSFTQALDTTSASATHLASAIEITNSSKPLHMGVIVLDDNTSLQTNDGNVTVDSTIDGAKALAISTGTGVISLVGAIGGGEPLTALALGSTSGLTLPSIDVNQGISVDTGPILLGGAMNCMAVTLTAQGSIQNVAGAVALSSSSAASFNAIGGDIGTSSSPVEINTPGVIAVGADPAYFIGTPHHTCVLFIPSNVPAFVQFNGVNITGCVPSSSGSTILTIPPRDFYVQGIYSSWDNLSNYYYFLADPIDSENLLPKKAPVFWSDKKIPEKYEEENLLWKFWSF